MSFFIGDRGFVFKHTVSSDGQWQVDGTVLPFIALRRTKKHLGLWIIVGGHLFGIGTAHREDL